MGGGADRPWGRVLIAALVIPALGLGSNVLRIQTKTILDLEVIPNAERYRIAVAGINALLALLIALRDGEIIGLILRFYAAYLSTAWIPFIAYLLAHRGVYYFSQLSVRVSLLLSSLAALSGLAVTFVQPSFAFHSPELTILLIGLGVGSFSLFTVQLIESFPTPSQPQDETQT
jgi:SSS family solute:Na+ symporter